MNPIPPRALAVALLMVLLAPTLSAAEFVGVVYPKRDLTLSLGLAGVVDAVDVEVGQTVSAAQPLIRLRADIERTEVARRRAIFENESALRAEESRLAILEKLYRDAESLFEGAGSISGQELSQLRIEYVSAEGRVEQLRSEKEREELEFEMARHELDLRTLAAPIDGVITELDLDVGEWVNPSDTALRLVDASECVLRVSVDERSAYGIEAGMRMPVRVENMPGGGTREGIVTFVSPVADAASGLVPVRVALANDDGRIRPGAKASISMDAAGSAGP